MEQNGGEISGKNPLPEKGLKSTSRLMPWSGGEKSYSEELILEKTKKGSQTSGRNPVRGEYLDARETHEEAQNCLPK